MEYKRFISLLLIFLASHSAHTQTSPVFSAEQISLFKDSVNRIMVTQHIPSLMLAIVTRDTTLLVDGIGTANLDTNRSADKETLYPMGSITKTFTALAIMRLVEQRKLSLTDNLKQIAPEVPFTNDWERVHPLRIINLLEHTSGFDDVHFNALFNFEGRVSEYTAVMQFRNSMKCRWYPGERMAYCNTDYVILGYLIEKLSGKSYADFLTNQVLHPLGMDRSYFNKINQPGLEYAQGYTWDDNRFIKVPSFDIYGSGEGGLYSCAEDMGKFVRFILNNGKADKAQVFSSATLDSMETPISCVAAQEGLRTGYGSGITNGFLTSKHPFYGHDGLTPDFASRYAYNRQLGVGFATCGSDVEPFNELIINFLTQSLPSQPPSPSIKLDNKSIGPYLGYYRLKTPRFQIFRYLEEVFHGYHIELQNDSLFSYGFKRPRTQLIETAPFVFRKNNETLPSILLTKNEQGKAVLYDWGAYFEKVSFTQVVIERILLLGSISSAIALLASLIAWLFMTLFKKLTWREWATRCVSSFGALFLFAAFGAFAYLGSNPATIGSFNFLTAFYFFGTVLFASLSITGFIITMLRWKIITNSWTRLYLAITSTWSLYLVYFLFHYDLLGLRMWSF